MASVPNSGSATPPPPPVWDAQPVGSTQVAYGGFWIRLVAYIIDAILISLVFGMEKFTTLSGVAAPLPMVNVDTDMIIPKQFLKTIKRTGLKEGLFYEMRYGGRPEEGLRARPAGLPARPRSSWRATISAAARRAKHAPWALLDFGIRCVISEELRRHLLQQLLQERHPADQGAEGDRRQADGRCRAAAPMPSSRSTSRSRRSRVRTAAPSTSTSTRSARSA
jgi:hypothetical protein